MRSCGRREQAHEPDLLMGWQTAASAIARWSGDGLQQGGIADAGVEQAQVVVDFGNGPTVVFRDRGFAAGRLLVDGNGRRQADRSTSVYHLSQNWRAQADNVRQRRWHIRHRWRSSRDDLPDPDRP